MNFEQSINRFNKIWFISFTTALLLVILVYTINYFYTVDFFIFDTITLLLYTLIPGSLGAISIWAIRYEKINDVPKKSLIFLSLAFVCWFLAEQVWMLYDYVLLTDPFPSIADIFYMSAPLLMLISLVIFLKPLKNQITKKSIIIATSVSLLLLIPTVLITYQESSDVDFIELFIVLFYPILDALILIPIIIIVLFLIHGKKNPFWIMITLGMVILIIADTSYLFLELTDNYTENHPVNLLWLVSYVIWIFCFWRSIHISKISFDKENNLKNYKKYETQLFSRYGAITFLIIMNVTVVIILLSINYLVTYQSNLEFLKFFTSFLVMIMVIFSVLIILLNKTMQKNLQLQTSAIENISNELIKAERFSAIGELASRLAHDMRNPLGVIISSITLIKNNPTKEVVSKNIERLQRSSDRMEHQINNVMDFVRIRKLNLKKIPLHTLIDDAIHTLIVPNGITIKKPIENPIIQCDAEQFLILFYNIIHNAIQKLENNGSIIINYDHDDLNNIIKIQDSGESIPDEIISNIFEPLFTTKYHGTGLGLASCEQIVKQHKGTIKVENNPTTFIILIPKNIKI